MKPQIILIILCVLAVCFSCGDSNKSLEYPILKASLTEKQISVYDIFKEVVIIPLETTNESSFRYIEKIEVYGDSIYIFDSSLNSLYIFGLDGKYKSKIYRVGQGPEEYIRVYDFLINHKHRMVEMLNPMGSIHKYGMDGTFIRQDDLPKPPMNYRNFALLDDNHYVTWSSLIGDDDGGLNIIASNDYQQIGSYFPNSSLWGAFVRAVFYKYKDSVYYHESMTNKVYHVTSNGCKIAYEWDLGVDIIDAKKLVAPKETVNKALMALGEDFKEGKIPFCFDKQFQMGKYYYASLRFGFSTRKSLFYDKVKKESILFEKTKEGVKVDILFMTDDYAIGTLEYEHRAALHSLVSPNSIELLNEMKVDDNVWLIKFVF